MRVLDPSRCEIAFEQSERWVRGTIDGDTVVDSRNLRLVWEPGSPIPRYAFPRRDVRTELLRAGERPADARPERDAHYDLQLRERTIAHAAWTWRNGELGDHLGFEWSALDHWYEEDEEVFAHPRDPYTRIDALSSSRHVVVRIDGETVADTRRPLLLFETRLPVRFYLPPADVRRDLLVGSEAHSFCPYKGRASYYSVRTSSGLHEDVAWYYREPFDEVRRIRDAICFYNDRVELIVDGAPHGR